MIVFRSRLVRESLGSAVNACSSERIRPTARTTELKLGAFLDPTAPMGHWLPHAFRADGSFVFSLEEAVSYLTTLLYQGIPTPQEPQNDGTMPKTERNAEIRARYAEGDVSVADLAAEYGLSPQRIHQIIHGRRK